MYYIEFVRYRTGSLPPEIVYRANAEFEHLAEAMELGTKLWRASETEKADLLHIVQDDGGLVFSQWMNPSPDAATRILNRALRKK